MTNGEDNTAFNRGPQFLFRNGGNENHWLRIKLVGTVSNRQGLGAKVTVQTGQIKQYREMNDADGHFYGQGSTPLHFGLGAARRISSITVQWPSGVIQSVRRVRADQAITITEGE